MLTQYEELRAARGGGHGSRVNNNSTALLNLSNDIDDIQDSNRFSQSSQWSQGGINAENHLQNRLSLEYGNVYEEEGVPMSAPYSPITSPAGHRISSQVEMARDQEKRRLSAMSGRSSMQADMAIHMEDDVPLQYEGSTRIHA